MRQYAGYNPSNNPYNQGGGYGQGGYNQGGNSPGGYSNPFDDRNAAGNVEMESLSGGQDPILQKCSAIGSDIKNLDKKLDYLSGLHSRFRTEADQSATSDTKQEIEAETTNIMGKFHTLKDRVQNLKQTPGINNSNRAPIGLTERQLKAAINKFQKIENDSRKRMQEQMERQVRIVNRDASDEEIRAAVERNDPSIFQQALMQGNRLGQANTVLSAVRDRHREMQEVERRLGELIDLLNDMQSLLIKQEAAVVAIDHNAEQAAEDMGKANEQLEVAVTTARKTRKKKWICLGICVIIILIIVGAVVAYVMANRGGGGGGNNNAAPVPAPTTTPAPAPAETKRHLLGRGVLDDLRMNNARTLELSSPEIEIPSRSINSDSGPFSQLSRRRFNRIRDMAGASHQETDFPVVKRAVIWEGLEPTDSED
ncbi:t-SNARE [Podospora australis]|uniref:t-SNARE n=1 Tax=Podospora australis TaxID=1536484 RepID=A0AAN6WX90_9PEZI|nr:t-SNARE [Podospora australis]